MTMHELKLNSVFFDAVANGFKTFEVRKDDRGFKVGDTLLLKEIEFPGEGKLSPTINYTGRQCVAAVSYILTHDDFPNGIAEGYVVMGIVLRNQETVHATAEMAS